jgi:hypothetical protein
MILEAPGCPGPSRVEEGGGSDRQVVKSCLPTSTVMRKRDSADFYWVQFYLGCWPLLFSKEWWGHIRYGLYGFPAVCCWREPVVSRILGRNRRPAVPGVLDPNKFSLSIIYSYPHRASCQYTFYPILSIYSQIPSFQAPR